MLKTSTMSEWPLSITLCDRKILQPLHYQVTNYFNTQRKTFRFYFSAVNEKTKHCLLKSLEIKTSWQESCSNFGDILKSIILWHSFTVLKGKV